MTLVILDEIHTKAGDEIAVVFLNPRAVDNKTDSWSNAPAAAISSPSRPTLPSAIPAGKTRVFLHRGKFRFPTAKQPI